MGAIVTVTSLGNHLVAADQYGAQTLLLPTGRGVWIPAASDGTVATGAGETAGNVPGTTTVTPGTSAAAVDDYPWPDAPEDELSPLRYSYRDCTDFVAWRINRDAGCVAAPWKYTWGNLRWQGAGGNGDAIGWRADWVRYGRAVDQPAAAGRIGWYGSKAGTYGHVNYVQSVDPDGTVHLEEYNWSPNHQAYGTRTAAPGSAYYPDSFLTMPT